MKLDDIFSDDNILKASGFISAGPSVGHLVLHTFGQAVTTKNDTSSSFGTMGRVGMRITLASLSARDLALGFNKEALPKTKKNALKILGAGNLALSAWFVDGIKNKKEFKEVGYGFAAAHALLGALAIFKGFKPE